MGYQTYFAGDWTVVPPLRPEHRDYLAAFASTRRMMRDEEIAAQLPDPKREAVGLPIGTDGAYFVGSEENFGQNDDASVLDHNEAPGNGVRDFALNIRPMTEEETRGMVLYDANIGERCTQEGPHGSLRGDHGCDYAYVEPPKDDRQPGLWCQWVPSADGTVIEWDEGEKFYDYIEWIGYLLNHFLTPWGYQLDGVVEWDGEESSDRGAIKCTPLADGHTKVTILVPGEFVELLSYDA